MILLVTHAQPTIERYGGDVGRLVQPRHFSRIAETASATYGDAEQRYVWAADNDFYVLWAMRQKYLAGKITAGELAAATTKIEAAFGRMLVALRGLEGCRFISVPDVVGDHEATLERWYEWSDVVGVYGPPAFVIQDGCTVYDVPWRDIGAIFVGGSTEYKLGVDAERIVREALRRGIWVHVGRVNSLQRIRYAAEIGAHSIDGTSAVMFEKVYMQKFADAARIGSPKLRLHL